MRLHRLRVKDFRGVEEREIEFADSGVTVIEGDNEAGKSSMMEAFDLLLSVRADSKAKNVRAVQPSGRDVGTEVWADVSCGRWRFEYFKRFNKSVETTLTVVEPAHEQLTGRDAHQRVERILAESLDHSLFDAFRLLQSADPDLGAMTDSAALSRALDRAAGSSESGDGETRETQDLVAAATAEYKKYFTVAQGRPTGELAEAIAEADATEKAVAERTAILESVQVATDRLPVVAERIAALLDAERSGQVDVATAAAALADAESVREKCVAARAVVESRGMAAAAAEDAVKRRVERRARLHHAQAAIEKAQADIAVAREESDRAGERAGALASELAAATDRLSALRTELSNAEYAAAVAAGRSRRERIEATLTEVDRLQGELTAAQTAAAATTVTGDDVRLSIRLYREITTAAARLDAVAATVTVTRLGADDVLLNDEAVDDVAEVSASQPTVIELPGAARVSITPGTDSAALAAELEGLRTQEADLLKRCGVAALDEVPAVANRRAEALTRAKDLERAIGRELGGTSRDDLLAQRADIESWLPAELPTAGEPADPAELRTAERELADLIVQTERRRDAELSTQREQSGRAQTLSESVATSVSEAEVLRTDLDAEVTAASDEALQSRVAEAAAEFAAAKEAADKLDAQLAALDIARVRNDLEQREAAQDRVRKQLADAKTEQTELATRLEVCRTDGRLDELSDAVAENDAAQARRKRVSERAAGARALHETLQRKRTESRARYVDPFAQRLEQLAGPVFGDGVRFHIADDFTIVSRTLGGVTVDVEALSGGAKEQLGLLARIACATLVDVDDGVPLILDDALGYTDPTRLASMAQVLGTSGGDAQIIVLTCTPDRYRDVDGARLIAV